MSRLRTRDLMTAEVFTVKPDDDALAVQALMHGKSIRHVPVVGDDGLLAGLVSDRDLIRKTSRLEGEVPVGTATDVLRTLKVRDVMTADVETVDVDDGIDAAAQIMLENKYGCVPVMEEGLLAGVLTEADFVRFVADGRALATS